MTTDMSQRPGTLGRLIKKVAKWSEALDYSSFEYTHDRIASIERELAEIKAQMRQLEVTRHGPPDVPIR